MNRQPAFLSDNQLEDSDNLFRLKPGKADTSLICFAKVTEENSGMWSVEIVLENILI